MALVVAAAAEPSESDQGLTGTALEEPESTPQESAVADSNVLRTARDSKPKPAGAKGQVSSESAVPPVALAVRSAAPTSSHSYSG